MTNYVILDGDDTTAHTSTDFGPTGASEVGDWVDYVMCSTHLTLAPLEVQQAATPTTTECDVVDSFGRHMRR